MPLTRALSSRAAMSPTARFPIGRFPIGRFLAVLSTLVLVACAPSPPPSDHAGSPSSPPPSTVPAALEPTDVPVTTLPTTTTLPADPFVAAAALEPAKFLKRES